MFSRCEFKFQEGSGVPFHMALGPKMIPGLKKNKPTVLVNPKNLPKTFFLFSMDFLYLFDPQTPLVLGVFFVPPGPQKQLHGPSHAMSHCPKQRGMPMLILLVKITRFSTQPGFQPSLYPNWFQERNVFL